MKLIYFILYGMVSMLCIRMGEALHNNLLYVASNHTKITSQRKPLKQSQPFLINHSPIVFYDCL